MARAIGESLLPLAPSAAALLASIIILGFASRLLERRRIQKGAPRVGKQLILTVLFIISVVGVILALPVSETTQGQLLSFVGILISASIALSSGTLVANAISGLMLRFGVSKIQLGDLIDVGEQSGWVTELGILHTQLQTLARDLIWLPNQWIVSRPTRVIQPSGTFISETVSLVYDVPRKTVEQLLEAAAEDAGLEPPRWKGIAALGESSVAYQVGGVVTDIQSINPAHRRLRAAIMDRLQNAGISLVAPRLIRTEEGETVSGGFEAWAEAEPPTAPIVSSGPGLGAEPGPEPEPEQEARPEPVLDRLAAATRVEREQREAREQLSEAQRRLSSPQTDPKTRARLAREVRKLERRLHELEDEAEGLRGG